MIDSIISEKIVSTALASTCGHERAVSTWLAKGPSSGSALAVVTRDRRAGMRLTPEVYDCTVCVFVRNLAIKFHDDIGRLDPFDTARPQ
jgi:hypothetical protein